MIVGIRKPPGVTSHDIVNRVRRITGEARVGHGGTLDPFAEGVLVIGITRDSTKKLRDILKNADKEYLATLKLGKTSTTGDPEGDIVTRVQRSGFEGLTEERIRDVLKKFTGRIMQTPPAYSAVKVGGVPAYRRARQGKPVALAPREVEVKELELVEFRAPILTIRTVVSSGTYIRSLARDIGEALGTGAYLTRLVRTRVGTFTLAESVPPEKLESTYRSR